MPWPAGKQYREIAKRIIDKTLEEYGSPAGFYDAAYGNEKLSKQQILKKFNAYAKRNKLPSGYVKVMFKDDFRCLAQCHSLSDYKIELWLLEGLENMRCGSKIGINALCAHEVGTHLIRSYNDVRQPWAHCRHDFGVSNKSLRMSKQIEEGFAKLNEVIQTSSPSLYRSALRYYITSLVHEMTEEELIVHVEKYFIDTQKVQRLIRRVKMVQGKIQIYFEGCVRILQNIDSIDFDILFAGKINLKDAAKLKKVVRRRFVKLPKFYSRNRKRYLEKLREVKLFNEIPESAQTGKFKRP